MNRKHRSRSYANAALVAMLAGQTLMSRAQTPPGEAPLAIDAVEVRETSANGPAVASATPPPSSIGTGISDLAGEIPNLAIALAGTSSFGAIYTLRGLSNTPYFSDPSVVLYVDEIPLAGSFSYPTDLSGLGNTNVFYGPQATAFGRAAEGGVIVLDPVTPNNTAFATLGAGTQRSQWEKLEAGATEGLSGDTFVSASRAQRSGYIENTEIHASVDTLRSFSSFLRQRFRPAARVEITVELLDDLHHDGAAPLVPLGGPLRTVSRAEEGATDSNLAGAAAKVSVETPIGSLSATSSGTRWSLNPYLDWLVLPPALQSRLTQRQDAWNEEIRLRQSRRGAAEWQVGTWFSSSTTDGASDRSIDGSLPIEVSHYGYAKREVAAFGNVVLALAPGWSLLAGLRVQAVEKNYHQDEQVPTPDLHLVFRRDDRKVLPELKVRFDDGSGTSGFAGISVGTKPGGYSAYTDNPAFISFAAESAAALEAGLSRFFHHRGLSLSVRIYDYEIRNYQIERSFSATDYFVATAHRARSTGLEAVFGGQVSPEWSLTANAGLGRVVLLDFTDPLSGTGEHGERAPYAPAFTAGAALGYHSSLGWFAGGDLRLQGRTFYSEAEDSRLSQSAYAVVAFDAGFETGRWRLTGFAGNVFGRGYVTLIVPGVASAAPGPPFTLGIELRFSL